MDENECSQYFPEEDYMNMTQVSGLTHEYSQSLFSDLEMELSPVPKLSESLPSLIESSFNDSNVQKSQSQSFRPISHWRSQFKDSLFSQTKSELRIERVIQTTDIPLIFSSHEFIKTQSGSIDTVWIARLEIFRPLLLKKLEMVYSPIKVLTIHDTIASLLCHDRDTSLEWDSNSELVNNSLEPKKKQALIGILERRSPTQLPIIAKMCNDIGINVMPLGSLQEENDSRQANNKRHDVVISDNSGFVCLDISACAAGRENISKIINGAPCCVTGHLVKETFIVEKLLYATPVSPVWPESTGELESIFVSGIELNNNSASLMYLNLLSEYLMHLCGSRGEQAAQSCRMRVFFVGNSFGIMEPVDLSSIDSLSSSRSLVAEYFDTFLVELAQIMEVFVVTGRKDPTPVTQLPHPPLHSALFPLASQLPTFHLLSNPCQFNITIKNGDRTNPENYLKVVATSGENINTISQYSGSESLMDISKSLLQCGHLFPTEHYGSMDTEEMLIIRKRLPHLFVIGNQHEFATGSFNGTKIVRVPKFCKSHTIVLFTKNFDVFPIKLLAT